MQDKLSVKAAILKKETEQPFRLFQLQRRETTGFSLYKYRRNPKISELLLELLWISSLTNDRTPHVSENLILQSNEALD